MSPIEHALDLPRYTSWRPTAMDPKGLGLDDRQQWLVTPGIRSRDSGILEQSNFDCLLKILGGEGEHVEVHRFGHWGPGWFEIIIVDPEAPEKILVALGEAVCALGSYPILNDDDFSERESNAVLDSWELMSLGDKIDYVTKAGGCYLLARYNLYEMSEVNAAVQQRVWDRIVSNL